MSRTASRPLLAALFVLILAALGCEQSNVPPTPEYVPDAYACDATPYVSVTGGITLQETNQFGTRACEYTLVVTSAHPDTPIRFYIFRHDRDGYQGTESSRWTGNFLIQPGRSETWTGSIYIYSDPDASGPVMAIAERIAAVFDTVECAAQRRDLNFLQEISIPLGPVCPIE